MVVSSVQKALQRERQMVQKGRGIKVEDKKITTFEQLHKGYNPIKKGTKGTVEVGITHLIV